MREKGQDIYSGIYTFLGCDYVTELNSDIDCVIYGMPFDTGTTNRSGTRFGPRAVRKYGSCKPYHEEFDIDIFEDFKVVDFGDFPISAGYVNEDMSSVIGSLSNIIQNDVVTIGIGGDHTLAYPELRALKEKYGELAFVHFDSHTDTWCIPGIDGTTRINHATPFRLAMEQGCIKKGSAIQVGMRGGLTTSEDHKYALENGFEIVTGNKLHVIGIDECARLIKEKVGDTPLFVTFDIDFLDPAYAPGTGTPVCGGFSTAEAIELLQKSLIGTNIVGMDLVEIAPCYDPAEITAYAGKTLLREFVSILSYNKKNK